MDGTKDSRQTIWHFFGCWKALHQFSELLGVRGCSFDCRFYTNVGTTNVFPTTIGRRSDWAVGYFVFWSICLPPFMPREAVECQFSKTSVSPGPLSQFILLYSTESAVKTAHDCCESCFIFTSLLLVSEIKVFEEWIRQKNLA